jgi:hypothetical protein
MWFTCAKFSTWISLTVCVGILEMQAHAQNRGVYPLGMSVTNSGVTPAPGFTYVNQLLFYSRDHSKDNAGNALPVRGENYVLMDMNTLAWVSKKMFLGGAHYSAAATLPFAKNSLTSDVAGKVSGGGGFADSYYLPFILGWDKERVAIRAIYGFLAPSGRFAASANDNVGSGYWTHALSSGQTFYLNNNKRWVLSTFEMYEFHTRQEETRIHPGDTFDLDYSLLGPLPSPRNVQLQAGLVGYEQRQTTARTGPTISQTASADRYAVNGIGFGMTASFPNRKAGLGFRYFKEFANRSTFQGYSLQLLGSITF